MQAARTGPIALRFLVAFVAVFCIGWASGCGISTHITIARFALDFFSPTNHPMYKEIAWKHQDAFQAGNPYPDAMYNSLCFKGDFHAVAEDTHWTPFANATAAYIKKTYPQPWDEKTEKLVAFFLGFVSHQVADISWHSLGVDRGFLADMGNVNFYGSFGAAHSVGDEGGDVVANFEFDLKFIAEVGKWYVPIADLLNIYQEYYGQKVVNATVLEECTAWLFLGRLGERLALAKTFQEYSAKSSFLVEDFTEYFLGGVYDMAAWTSLSWNQTTIPMIEHGPATCDLNHNPMFVTCSNTSAPSIHPDVAKDADKKKSKGCMNRHGLAERLSKVTDSLTLDDIKVTRTAHGVSFEPSDDIKVLLDEMDKTIAASKEKVGAMKTVGIDAASAPAVFTTSTNHSRLGWSVVSGDFNNDGIPDAVLGAPGAGDSTKPQHGRVFIVYGQKGKAFGDLNLDTGANLVLEGTEVHGRFGSAIAVVDLNSDGVDDLAVSAPSIGTADLSYLGKVYVYFGRANSTLSTTPGLVINGVAVQTNLGWSLAGGDLDNDGFADLVVGSPFAAGSAGNQAGVVTIYKSSASSSSGVLSGLASAVSAGKVFEISANDADATLSGEMQYSWFGYSISVHSVATGSNVLLVSAPTVRICSNTDCSFSNQDIQSVGKLYAFLPFSSATPVFTLRGSEALSKLGRSATIGFPFGPNNGAHVIVGAPNTNATGKIAGVSDTLNQAGAVYILKLADLLGKNLDLSSAPVVTSFFGDRRFARLGWSVDVADVNGDGNDDVLVSAPLRTDDLTGEIYGGEEGIVYVFYGGSAFPKGDATKACGLLGANQPCPSRVANVVLQPNESFSRFGGAFRAIDLTGSGRRNTVVAGSVQSNKGSYLAGTATVFTLA